MCGRFTLTAPIYDILEQFEIEQFLQEELFQTSYNIAPSHSVLAVINDGAKNRLGYLNWGLVPSWAKDIKIGYKMINARAETLLEKPSFKQAYLKRRCLVLADSFYEWKRNSDGTKTPMRIKLKNDEVFGMAGIWEKWQSGEGKPYYSCSVITTGSNELIKDIHDRMPVILEKEVQQQWLNPSITNISQLNSLLTSYNEDLMETYEVSNLVNSPKNNSVELIQRIC
ncbi:SOS response-associated peptidase [Peribacillus alkalitolerans]|uniref:SOS response-associated peptidase n=1 Tax=Peribacillus alkalitolerans TaxID=1550385 RepID=UPI0013D3C7CB|nr:SOS response-associated peptidase [Peribacillus alkalitolerans]